MGRTGPWTSGRLVCAFVRGSFGTNFQKLQAVKAAYDPTNFFQSNFNIPPGG